MTWDCLDCAEDSSDESIWCEECGQERLSGFDSSPVEEAERDLPSGDTQTSISVRSARARHRSWDLAEDMIDSEGLSTDALVSQIDEGWSGSTEQSYIARGDPPFDKAYRRTMREP